jgi:ribosome-associated translation inhibitor RaiA
MALKIQLTTGDLDLSPGQEKRVLHQLRSLERRLVHFPEPIASLTVRDHRAQRRVTVDLRVELVPHGSHLISHQAADTVEHAVRLAVDDVERQLERHIAKLRGEPTFGVPSRRLPENLRPHSPGESSEGEEEMELLEASEEIEYVEEGEEFRPVEGTERGRPV